MGGDNLSYKMPSICPVCTNKLEISSLSCSHCQTKLEGRFTPCKFCQLPNEQLGFIETFIKCRGNIKDVEKELGISYPTVRNRLELVIQALGYKIDKTQEKLSLDERKEVLESLDKGELTPQEALERLKKFKE